MTAPRRALHVFSTFGAGGPQVRATQIMPRMGPSWRHEIIAMNGDTAAAAMIDAAVERVVLPTPPKRSFLASVRTFTSSLRHDPPDLLLTYNWGAIEAVIAARWLRLPFVHHEDGFLRGEFDRRLRRRNWLRIVLLRNVPVIVPSLWLLRVAREEWHLRERLVQLPNGVDVARYRPGPPRPPSPLFTIGTVGGLRPEKDHRLLLHAVAALTVPARVLFVGDGPERPRLEQLARELELGDRAVFRGATSDTVPCFHEFDLFALSSRTEQMPLSLLEAMASGLPVASTDVGDVRAMLPAECHGSLVPHGDPRALAAAIGSLATDPARRLREGQANRRHAVEHFELGACMDRYVAVYAEVAGAQRRRSGGG